MTPKYILSYNLNFYIKYSIHIWKKGTLLFGWNFALLANTGKIIVMKKKNNQTFYWLFWIIKIAVIDMP